MVAKPEFLGHFIFNSDYPTDKIVWLKEGQTTSPSSVTTKYVNFNMLDIFGTNLPIFVKGAYSFNNWQSAYMIGTRNSATNEPDTYIDVGLRYGGKNSVIPPAGTLQLSVATTNSQGASKSLKYRLWGVVPEFTQQAVDRPKNSSATKSKLIFNSDMNYPRLFKDGVANAGDVITHNLGRAPYVDYWVLSNDITGTWNYNPTGGAGSGYTGAGIRANNSTVTFWGSNTVYYYRIYA